MPTIGGKIYSEFEGKIKVETVKPSDSERTFSKADYECGKKIRCQPTTTCPLAE